MHDRQTTRNNFVDKEKDEILSVNTSQNFALVCMRFLASTGSHLLSFASMSWSSFCFDKILKCVIYGKFCHEAKLQTFVKTQTTRYPEL